MGLINNLVELYGESRRIKNSKDNENKLTEDEKARLNNIRNAAEAGDANAMFTMGNIYSAGKYVEYNPNMICQYWEAAAKHGHVDAMFNLGLLYMGNESKYFFDDNKAGYWLEQAANLGDREAQEVLNEKFIYSKWSNKWKLK